MSKYIRKYYPLNYPGTNVTNSGVTGIRSRCRNHRTEVFVTGFYRTEESTGSLSFIYQGDKRGNGIFHDLNFTPQPGITPTATELYSLDLLRKNKIRAVGSFSAEEFDGVRSCLYEGTLQGEGKWTSLLPNLSALPVLSSIAHSVMGDVVVGNYKTDARFSNAYIYDVKTQQYFPVVTSQFPIVSISAYGVWQNEGDSYTIVGGLATSPENPDLTVAFVVDWNNTTRILSNWRTFQSPDALASHFEGISGVCKGYTLAGQSAQYPYFVTLRKNKIEWIKVDYPDSTLTTSDSVANDILIGSFMTESQSGLQGYISYLSRH